MRLFKVLLFCLLLLLVAWAWCAEIHDAALNGDLAKVKELLAKDPSLLNAKGKNEKAPLHWAAQGGHLAIVKYLISKGAAIDELNIQKETALVYAAEGGHLNVAEFLIAKGAKVNVKTTLDALPIHYAVWAGKAELVKLLVAKGADLKLTRGQGFALIHEAAGGESLEIVDLLLKKGMPVDLKTGFGATPLHYASLHGTPQIVSLLIKRGADVNAVSQDDWWPLGLAVSQGSSEKVALLLAAGADATRKAKASGRTPLQQAAILGYSGIARQLLAKGGAANAKDEAGLTPVEYAQRYGHAKLAQELSPAEAEKNAFEKKDLLGKPLKEGQAIIWFTGHSGWVIKTKNHLLVFDYWKNQQLPDEPSLANGAVVPEEIKNQAVTVFSSHGHDDHYMPEIFDWKKTIPSVTYVMGFDPENQTGYAKVPDRETKNLNGVEITAIPSTDSGQGFFVKTDGVSIFHPGDHTNRNRDFSGPFKKEIDFLADQGLRADILFAPVGGCGFGDQEAVRKGVYYTIDRFAARCIFPMHAGVGTDRYREYAKTARAAGYEQQFGCPENSGDIFIVTSEGLKAPYAGTEMCKKTENSGCNR